MNSIQIRYASPADTDHVYRFVCDLEDKVFDRGLFGRYYAEHIANPRYYYLVAIDHDLPVGYLSCHGQFLLHHMDHVYEIQELFVDKAYRGRGVGKMLITQLEELLAGKNYDMLEVASGFRRTDSHEFYKAAGFGQTHYKFTKEKRQ